MRQKKISEAMVKTWVLCMKHNIKEFGEDKTLKIIDLFHSPQARLRYRQYYKLALKEMEDETKRHQI